jgi:hypothetical protein
MAKNWAITFGVIFVIVGLLGYIGGAGIVGPTGIFVTDTVHDTIHFLTGLIFLIVAFAAPQSSAGTMKTFGIIYLIIGLVGFASPTMFGLIAGNGADVWLHLVLGIVITWAGFSAGKRMGAPMTV